ncbi:nitrate ABC transporter permease [Nocardioides silvaticus]|uniref:Nitrate ABC transporter permease n=1 Tax=Nocardioides silvaticus TaxID=2201891 RepID=A0A316TK48_9ACTN|nr:ABC transporter permease subunit [Nocardioides silvaticus]PWN02642.1 nitrate ABC transporter permease [Nocardioides silvaticus]
MTTAVDPVAAGRVTRPRLPITDVRWSTVVAPLALGALVIVGWELLVNAADIKPFVLPAPSAIWEQITGNTANIVDGSVVTGRNALIGMLGGAVVGVIGAALAGSFRLIDQMAAPVVAALAVIPIVALAPVLYSMFGAAVNTGRIIVAGISVAVPVYLNTLRGIRQVRAVHRDLMTAYAAGPLQVIRAVTLPTATPYVFTGLRVASSLAVIAALIAEYFGGPIGGLGKSITSSAASSNYPLAWAYVSGAIVLGLLFYVVTLLVELWFSRHHKPA